MPRYIDADALKRKAQKVATEAWKMKLTAKIETTLNQFIDWIDEQPTVDHIAEDGKKASISCGHENGKDAIYRQDAIDALDCINGVEEVLRSLPTAQQEPEEFEWCRDCKEYDQTAHCCHRWTKVIQQTVAELKAEPKPGTWIYDGDCYKCNKCGATYSWWADSQTSNYCPNCGAKMEGEEHV